jgi:hypothetical protein
MAITKSNKHKLSLDQDKPNEEGGCTLSTPYALMRSLILDSQISITPLPCTSRCFSAEQMSKRELNWMSRMSIYTPPQKIQPLHTDPAKFDTTRHTGARHQTRRCIETYRFEKLVVTASPNADLRSVSTHRMRPVRKNHVWMLSGLHRMLPALLPVS